MSIRETKDTHNCNYLLSLVLVILVQGLFLFRFGGVGRVFVFLQFRFLLRIDFLLVRRITVRIREARGEGRGERRGEGRGEEREEEREWRERGGRELV